MRSIFTNRLCCTYWKVLSMRVTKGLELSVHALNIDFHGYINYISHTSLTIMSRPARYQWTCQSFSLIWKENCTWFCNLLQRMPCLFSCWHLVLWPWEWLYRAVWSCISEFAQGKWQQAWLFQNVYLHLCWLRRKYSMMLTETGWT